MSVAPTPSEIFHRTVEEGDRGLDQSLLELVATSFIAGSAAAFGIGMVFLIVGRSGPDPPGSLPALPVLPRPDVGGSAPRYRERPGEPVADRSRHLGAEVPPGLPGRDRV